MKKIFLTLMVVGAVATAHASQADELQKAKESLCKQYAEAAESTMSAHQTGVPLADMLKTAERKGKTPWHLFPKESVIQAYSAPRFNTEEYQQRAIAEFRDKRHLDCLKLISQNVSAVE